MPTPPITPPAPAPALSATLVLGLAGLVLTTQLYVAVPVLEVLAGRYDVSPSRAASLTTAFSLAYAIGFLAVAPVVLRRGFRFSALAALTLLGATTTLLAVAPTVEVALVVRVLQGLAAAPFIPASLSYLTTRVSPRARAASVAGLIAMSFSAGLAGQIATRTLVDAIGWSGALAAEAAALLLVSALVAAVLPTDPPSAAATQGTATSPSDWLRPALVGRLFMGVVRQAPLRPLLLATPALLSAFVLVYTGLQLTGPVAVRADPDMFLALRASALPAIAVAPVISHRLRRRPPHHRAQVALALGAAGMAVAAAPLGVVWLAIALFVAVGGIAVAAPALVGAIAERAAAPGPANAVYSFALFAGAAAGSPLAAVLAPAGMPLIALSAAGLLAVAAVLAAAPTTSPITRGGTAATQHPTNSAPDPAS